MRGRQSWGLLWKARPGMTRTIPGSSDYSGRLTVSNPCSGTWATYLVLSGFFGWHTQWLNTSKQLTEQVYPVIFLRTGEYLSVFSLCRASIFLDRGIVSSNICSAFICVSKITMSGFILVTQRAGGIVPPPGVSMPGRSLKTVYCLSTFDAM